MGQVTGVTAEVGMRCTAIMSLSSTFTSCIISFVSLLFVHAVLFLLTVMVMRVRVTRSDQTTLTTIRPEMAGATRPRSATQQVKWSSMMRLDDVVCDADVSYLISSEEESTNHATVTLPIHSLSLPHCHTASSVLAMVHSQCCTRKQSPHNVSMVLNSLAVTLTLNR